MTVNEKKIKDASIELLHYQLNIVLKILYFIYTCSLKIRILITKIDE